MSSLSRPSPRPCWLLIQSLVVISVTCVSGTASGQRRGGKPTAAKPPKINLPASVRGKAEVDMQVVPVNAHTRSSIVAQARRLDSIVEAKLIAAGQRPNELSSDEVFLRRAYLDVAGRIPTLAEATTFLDSTDPNRRQDLIDQLLSSPDYVSNFYNFWADTLRLVERPQANIIADPYLAYVKDSIRTNQRYNQWVYEMLTADGKTWENPAVGFQLRDDGMPLPYIDNTVRVFLGTQIGCAQCHDHPFDQWSQYQFYQLAAFTAGTRTRIQKGSPGYEKQNPANVLINEAKKHHDKGRVPGEFQRIARANTYNVSEVKATMRLPHDYAYSDAKPKAAVEPAVLWGEIPTSAQGGSLREQFAAWVTSPENPQFSKTIVNRIWKRLLGVGMVEPIDDFRDEHPCVNEELMDLLCDELIRSDFDLKELMRMVLYSRHLPASSVRLRAHQRQNVSVPRTDRAADDSRTGLGFDPHARRSQSMALSTTHRRRHFSSRRHRLWHRQLQLGEETLRAVWRNLFHGSVQTQAEPACLPGKCVVPSQ